VADALLYADQTVGPDGKRMAVADRVAEKRTRYGSESAQARAHHRRSSYLVAAAERVELRLHG
jgi:hypothetical protein